MAATPGPTPQWLIGNLGLIYDKERPIIDSLLLLRAHKKLCHDFDELGLYNLQLGPTKLVIYLSKADTIEPLLNNNVNITKSDDLKLSNGWIGQGLVSTGGDKWKES